MKKLVSSLLALGLAASLPVTALAVSDSDTWSGSGNGPAIQVGYTALKAAPEFSETESIYVSLDWTVEEAAIKFDGDQYDYNAQLGEWMKMDDAKLSTDTMAAKVFVNLKNFSNRAIKWNGEFAPAKENCFSCTGALEDMTVEAATITKEADAIASPGTGYSSFDISFNGGINDVDESGTMGTLTVKLNVVNG